MGTIGHDDLLHRLRRWQIRAAIRGYYRRQRPHYEAARMLGLWTVSCQRSKDAPPLKLYDLIKFSWDRSEKRIEMSEEERQELLDMMRRENEQSTKRAPQQ